MSWRDAWNLRRDLKKMKSRKHADRASAALRLGAKGDKRSVEELIRLLNDDSPARTPAAALLATMREERAIRPLSDALLKMVTSAGEYSSHNSAADRLRVAEALKSFGPA